VGFLLLVLAVAAAGLLTGVLASVAIERWPRHEPLARVTPRGCPTCATPLPGLPGAPAGSSWLLRRGRCPACTGGLPRRWLVVELATCVLFAATASVWGPHPLLPALLVFAWSCVVATAIDLEHRIIPNRLTLRLPLVLLPLLVAAAAASGTWSDLRRALVAGVAVPFVMFVLSELFRLLRGQPGMGMGDVKYALSIGLVVGYLGVLPLFVFTYGSLLSSLLVAIALLASGRAKLASRIPFGPYLVVGAQLAVLAGGPLSRLVARLLLG
jgi:leader peptidase (prepilin peptidase) / N-methyltransferase